MNLGASVVVDNRLFYFGGLIDYNVNDEFYYHGFERKMEVMIVGCCIRSLKCPRLFQVYVMNPSLSLGWEKVGIKLEGKYAAINHVIYFNF